MPFFIGMQHFFDASFYKLLYIPRVEGKFHSWEHHKNIIIGPLHLDNNFAYVTSLFHGNILPSHLYMGFTYYGIPIIRM